MPSKTFKIAENRTFSRYFSNFAEMSEYMEPIHIGPARKIRVILDVWGIGEQNVATWRDQRTPRTYSTVDVEIQGSRDNTENSNWVAVEKPTAVTDPSPDLFDTPENFVWTRNNTKDFYPWIRVRVKLIRKGFESVPCGTGNMQYSVTVIADY